jgi:hypothetical protein
VTTKQNALYWREWGALVRHCKASGLPVPDRHDLHAAVVGADKSHLAFTNDDFDQVLAAFRSYSRPADLAGQLRQLNQPRIRLKYAINALAPSAAYWASIARDKFGTADLDALSMEQLTQLRNTLADRGRARRRRERVGRVGESPSLSDNRSLRGAGPDRVADESISVAT